MKYILVLVFLFCSLSAAKAQPFTAWVDTEDVWVQQERGPNIGLLRYGDVVRIVHCFPDCEGRASWLYLHPKGMVRNFSLSRTPTDREGEFLAGSPFSFMWGRVIRRTEGFDTGDEILLRQNPSLYRDGFLERPDGTHIPINNIDMLEPSTFVGWQNVPDRFGFIIRNTIVTRPDGTWRTLNRYDRFPAVLERNLVRMGEGTVPRQHVRIGWHRPRPTGVPRNARWVHVDLDQQVLTAYNGDALVFATLVSTGRRNGSTRTGVFTVRRKITHTRMRGGGRRPYDVEAVPWTLYFDGAIALHGAYWHDNFGQKMSHGCVNLSLQDAKFIFDFAPGVIPTGWRSIHPMEFSNDTLYVVIE